MNVTRIDYHAKADHYRRLASEAAYCAATALNPADRDAWDERAARYDQMADNAIQMARKAA